MVRTPWSVDLRGRVIRLMSVNSRQYLHDTWYTTTPHKAVLHLRTFMYSQRGNAAIDIYSVHKPAGQSRPLEPSWFQPVQVGPQPSKPACGQSPVRRRRPHQGLEDPRPPAAKARSTRTRSPRVRSGVVFSLPTMNLFFWSNVHYNYNVQGSLASGGSPAITGRSVHASKGRAWTLRGESAEHAVPSNGTRAGDR